MRSQYLSRPDPVRNSRRPPHQKLAWTRHRSFAHRLRLWITAAIGKPERLCGGRRRTFRRSRLHVEIRLTLCGEVCAIGCLPRQDGAMTHEHACLPGLVATRTVPFRLSLTSPREAALTEWEVIQLFEDRIAAGLSLTQTLRGTCGALIDWAAREWEKLSSDDRDELATVGAAMLCLSVRSAYPQKG
ncbi:hypothetical protein R75483_07845 [Paraburkholderia domus]|nr:hypothetical protein R75483_07845 [Paraburkholderia domus]